jgi:cobalt-zinc-cadmium efflux system membrane fusion protein
MTAWIRAITVGAVRRLPTLLTLALLGVLAVWGASYDWKLPARGTLLRGPGDQEKPPPEPSIKVVVDPAASASEEGSPVVPGTRIEFPSADAVRKADIRVDRAQVRRMAQYVTAPGMLDYDPSHYARLSSRAAGTVWRVYKEFGDPVRQGEVLALIDAAEVGKVKADFLQDLTQVEARSKTLRRMESAITAVPEQLRHDAETALSAARIRLFNDQQALLNLGLRVRIEDVAKLPDDQRVRHLRLLGLPEDILKQLDPETLTANLWPLTAPFSGWVISRDTAPGEVEQLTQPKVLFVVANVQHLHIELDVTPQDAMQLRPGQLVGFWPEGKDPGEAPAAQAKLTRIGLEVNEKTRRVRAHSEVDNPEGRLRPNSFGTGRILVDERPRAVVVPREAVQSEGTHHLVFVRLSETSFQVRQVHPGIRDAHFLEVDNVQPGEEIVTTGSYALKSELLKERIAGGED